LDYHTAREIERIALAGKRSRLFMNPLRPMNRQRGRQRGPKEIHK